MWDDEMIQRQVVLRLNGLDVPVRRCETHFNDWTREHEMVAILMPEPCGEKERYIKVAWSLRDAKPYGTDDDKWVQVLVERLHSEAIRLGYSAPPTPEPADAITVSLAAPWS